MTRARIALVMVRDQLDPFGTHALSSRLFAGHYRRRGYRVLFVDPTRLSEVAQAAGLMKAGEIAFAHCEQGHGISCQVALADGHRANLFRLYRVPAFAHLRDYPFCSWVRDKLLDTDPGVTIFHVDERAPELARRMGSPARHEFLPHAYLDPEAEGRPKVGNRPIRLLYVGGYQPPEFFRALWLSESGQPAVVFDRCVEAGVDEYHEPIWETLAGICGELAHPFDLARRETMDLVFLVNQFIRFERRRRMFAALCQRPEAVIVWAGKAPENTPPVRAQVLGKTRVDQTLALMDQAETMVMVLNNFSHGLSERLLSAMHRGCCVISLPNSLIESTFSHGRELLLADSDLRNLDALLEQAADPERRRAIVSAARERMAPAFSVAARVDEILATIGVR